ncbi:hypothetical protein [Williamsia sp. M5A3_1d]
MRSTSRLFDETDVVMTGVWTPDSGVSITNSELPQQWHDALSRIGRDLRIRHVNGSIEHIEFEAVHDRHADHVWLSSNVTPLGGTPRGLARR